MDAVLLKRLSEINDEEKRVLENGDINREIYMPEGSHVICYKKMLAAGKLIDVRKHTRFVKFPLHTHDYIEMVYMCLGKTTHVINGESVVLNKGEILLINKHAKQEILPSCEGDIAVNFIILPEFFDSVIQSDENNVLRRFIFSESQLPGGYLHFKVADILPIQNLVENLLWTFNSDVYNKSSISKMTMGVLFLNLLNYADKVDTKNHKDELALKVLCYVEEHYVGGSLTDLALFVHHDVYWLSRQIKKLTGKTYKELIQQKRITQAKFLLDSTEIGVAEIAERVGYSNISYFHRLFRSFTGVSPRNYRNRIIVHEKG